MMRAETVELVRALVLRRCHCASPPATQRKDAGFAKSGFVRAGEELRMSTPRAAVKLASLAAGIGLAALLSGPGLAANDAVQPDIVLPEPPEAPALFTVADQLGAAIAARLADAKFQLAPKLAKKDREAIAAFYARGDYKPLWLKDEAWTPAALAIA